MSCLQTILTVREALCHKERARSNHLTVRNLFLPLGFFGGGGGSGEAGLFLVHLALAQHHVPKG